MFKAKKCPIYHNLDNNFPQLKWAVILKCLFSEKIRTK